ncbi:MAG: hypothetical protein AAFR93_11280, partial [Pseudomonadota bacterium]
ASFGTAWMVFQASQGARFPEMLYPNAHGPLLVVLFALSMVLPGHGSRWIVVMALVLMALTGAGFALVGHSFGPQP